MKKNYMKPCIKMAVLLEGEEMLSVSIPTYRESDDPKIESSDEILSRRSHDIWADDDEYSE